MLHHLGQKTCAPWLEPSLIRHGLDFFVPIGYLFVSVFFFSSGYGLMEKLRANEDDYLDGFIGKHFCPIILIFILSDAIFRIYGGIASPYTWYIVAILYLYLIFYLAFRFCKKKGTAIAVIALGIILYCIECDRMVLGGWWINTVGIFMSGILFAENEEKISSFIKTRTLLKLIIALIILIPLTVIADKMNNALYASPDMHTYTVNRITVIVLQFISSLAMIFLCLTVSSIIRFNSKILDFIGSMTLEIYLIHGFFVELFGFCFVSEDVQPLIFIKNVWLYTLTVFVCTIPSAFLLKLARKGVVKFFSKERSFFISLRKNVKTILIVILCLLVALTVYRQINGLVNKSGLEKIVADYRDENIQFADVCGKKMAAYIAGDGDETIVIMRQLEDPCPTLSMKKVADELSEDYKVVVLDYLGSGFSDDPDTERTVQNITEEIHSALQSLNIKAPYILQPQTISGMYAQYYADKYPDEVKMVINSDAESAVSIKDLAEKFDMSLYEYIRYRNYSAEKYYIQARLIDFIGWEDSFWSVFEGSFAPGLRDNENTLAEYMFFKKIYNKYTVEEVHNLYDSMVKTEKLKYSRDTDVIEIVSSYYSGGRRTGADIAVYNRGICQSSKRHFTENVEYGWYCLTDRTDIFKNIADKYLK